MLKRIRDSDVQWGIAGVFFVTILVVILRRPGSTTWWKSNEFTRQVFYVAHVSLFMAFCVAVFEHVGQARKYVVEAVVGLVLNAVCCCVYAFLLK